MKAITFADLDRWLACDRAPGKRYSDERLTRLWGGDSITPLDLARCKAIPLKDRLWALLRGEVLGSALPGVLRDIVDPVVERHALHCGVKDVEEWARRWLSGEDRSAASARAAAWAARAAAWAARAAAWAAARAAAAQADGAAARAAEAAVGGKRARARERRRQLDIVVKALEDNA